jgi:hypothetical protein
VYAVDDADDGESLQTSSTTTTTPTPAQQKSPSANQMTVPSLREMLKVHKIGVMCYAIRDSQAVAGFSADLSSIKERLNLMKDRETKVITPNSHLCKQWDSVMLCLLLFTAFVTPFEVAFLSEGEAKVDGLFVINRLVDCLFAYDIWVNFNLAFYDRKRMNGVTDLGEIRWHYLTGWFLIDFVSLIPFEIMGMVAQSKGAMEVTPSKTCNYSGHSN